MNNRLHLQLGNGNEFVFISKPELLFCSFFKLQQSKIASKQLKLEDQVLWLRGDQVEKKCYYLEQNNLNISSSTYENLSLAERKLKWAISGLNTKEKLANERLYLVRIFDLIMLSWQRVNEDLKQLQDAQVVLRNEAGQIVSDSLIMLEKTLRQIEVHASRALYALWLDVGSVLVAVSGTGSIAIRQVWSLADLNYDEDQQAIAEGFKQIDSISLQQHAEALLIGADPEFALLNNKNQLVPASKFLDSHPSLHIGADALLYRGEVLYPLVELRPSPRKNPDHLVAQIKSLLQEAASYITDHDLRWLAGAMPAQGVALGGHIHFSGITLTSRLLRLLDLMIAIPLASIEDPAGRGRYRRYGSLGDYRLQSHGGFEYRTPPSWLVSPALTRAVLTLAYICVHDYDYLISVIQFDPAWFDAYYSGDYELLSSTSKYVFEQLRNCPSYIKLAAALDPLAKAVIEQKHWDESCDIRKRWSITN